MTVDWACELYHCVILNPGDSGLGVRVVLLCDINSR